MTKERASLSEYLPYVAFLLIVLVPASLILQKAGTPVKFLAWSAFAALVCAVCVPALFAYSPGLSAFSRLEENVPRPLAAMLPLAAMSPGGIALAFMVPAMEVAAWTTLSALVPGLVLAGAIRASAISQTGPLGVNGFIEERTGSRLLARIVCLVLALPLLAMLCGQAAAFGQLGALYLGLPFGMGLIFCMSLAVLQICVSGAKGIVLGSATLIFAAAALSATVWLQTDTPTSSSVAGPALEGIARLALPFIPFAELTAGHGQTGIFLTALVIGLAFSILPVFSSVPGPTRGAARRELATLASALVLLLALGLIFHIVILPGGGLQAAASQAGSWRQNSGISMASHVAVTILLVGLAISAAVPLYALSLMAGSLLRADGRGYLPARRLALARISVLAIAIVSAWLTLRFEFLIPYIAQLGVALTTASALPLFATLALMRRIRPMTAMSIVATGAIVTTAVFIAGPAVSAEGYGSLPVHPMVPAALSGMLAAAAVSAAYWATPLILSRKGK